MSEHVERSRQKFGAYINRLYENGLLLALALGLIVNGRAALWSASHKDGVAPFLTSAVKLLSPNAVGMGRSLIFFGMVLILVAAVYVVWEVRLIGTRVILALAGMWLYVAISVAIITGSEPAIAAERYEATAFLFFLAFVVNLSRWVFRGEHH